jgi:hypothetical protein
MENGVLNPTVVSEPEVPVMDCVPEPAKLEIIPVVALIL